MIRFAGLICVAVTALLAGRPVSAQEVHVDRVLGGLPWAWSLQFPREGGFLVGLMGMRLLWIDEKGGSHDLEGTPVDALPQGTTAAPADIALDPSNPEQFTACYARDLGAGLATTSVAFGRLDLAHGRVAEWRVAFDQTPRPQDPASSQPLGAHFWGCRVAWDGDSVIAALGIRDQAAVEVVPTETLGASVRVRRDGRFSVVTTGHRNPQGLAVHAGTIYESEHGPSGGDEVNVLLADRNYGWPFVGHGWGYDGKKIMRAATAPGVEEPIWYWAPSIAPSGLAYYDGKLFPDWRDSLLVGGLASHALHRLALRDGRVVGEQRLLADRDQRIRDVREGPDGAIYVLTDGPSGELLRLLP